MDPNARHTPARPPHEDAFAHRRRADPLGHRVQLVLAMICCFFLCWPTTVVEFAALPLLICFFVQIKRMLPLIPALLKQPLLWLAVGWAAWQALTLLWSPDPQQGLSEMGRLRWTYLIVLIWPVIDRRGHLVVALACGFLAGNLSQLIHGLGIAFDIDAITWDRMPDRISGWWDPVVGGTLLTAALGLHLGAAALGKARQRLFGLAGTLITYVAILATGTRGAWLAGAALIGIVAAWALFRAFRTPEHRPSARTAVVIAAVALTTAAAAWITIGESVTRRVHAAAEEVRAAVDDEHYTTDTGARLLMMWWAIEAFTERPITGVGAGGYRAWVESHLQGQSIDPETRWVHSHAHNAPLHIAATSGLVGLAIAIAVLAVSFRASIPAVRNPDRTGRFSAYGAAPPFALAGMVLVSMFDAVHLNAQTAAILWLLLTLCTRYNRNADPSTSAQANGRDQARVRSP